MRWVLRLWCSSKQIRIFMCLFRLIYDKTIVFMCLRLTYITQVRKRPTFLTFVLIHQTCDINISNGRIFDTLYSNVMYCFLLFSFPFGFSLWPNPIYLQKTVRVVESWIIQCRYIPKHHFSVRNNFLHQLLLYILIVEVWIYR